MTAPRFTGNVPSNVSKEAKYSVVRSATSWTIRLIYGISSRETALLTTKKHPRLVKMVNAVKEDVKGVEGGGFYINEYRTVLVPAGEDCYVAGQYDELLEFDFEGTIISPKAPRDLSPGAPWPGPRVGIRYIVTAGLDDIAYDSSPRPNVVRQIRLSDSTGATPARKLARRLSLHKGGSGRIYINEAREFFAPSSARETAAPIYLGSLEDEEWFPSPR